MGRRKHGYAPLWAGYVPAEVRRHYVEICAQLGPENVREARRLHVPVCRALATLVEITTEAP